MNRQSEMQFAYNCMSPEEKANISFEDWWEGMEIKKLIRLQKEQEMTPLERYFKEVDDRMMKGGIMEFFKRKQITTP
jgi:hypothetical protein